MSLSDPAILNILLPQGSDLILDFQLRHSAITRSLTKASLVPSSIRIEETGITMLAGQTVTIGVDELTLSSDLNPTDRILNVTSIPSDIKLGSVINCKPIDITGWIFNGKIKDLLGIVNISFTCSITDAINGKFRPSISNLITATIASNCTWQDLQGIDIQSLGQPKELLLENYTKETVARIANLVSVAYRWDIESIDTNLITNRRIEGLVMVSGEVTNG